MKSRNAILKCQRSLRWYILVKNGHLVLKLVILTPKRVNNIFGTGPQLMWKLFWTPFVLFNSYYFTTIPGGWLAGQSAGGINRDDNKPKKLNGTLISNMLNYFGFFMDLKCVTKLILYCYFVSFQTNLAAFIRPG